MHLRHLPALAVLASLSAGCTNPLPTAKELPDLKTAQIETARTFENSSPAIERVKVPASSMRPQIARAKVPSRVAETQLDIKFPSTHEANLASLVQTLSVTGVQVAFQWSDAGTGEDILNRKLPFLAFQGSLSELLQSLRTGLGVVAWYENGMIFLSDKEKYTVSMPQNEDVMTAISEELQSLGAEDVVTSLRGGKVIYTVDPNIQDEIISPYLKRMERNLAVVNMQVAIVSLAMNDNSSQGFDWNAFQVAFDSRQDTISGSSTDDTTTSSLNTGSLVNVTSSAISLSRTSLGDVFGTYGALTVASAISFLSNFGETKIEQNVSLRTLSGTEVSLRSGQEVPYVSEVSNTTTDGSTTGGTETETVETGLTIAMTPQFDSDAKVVTTDVSVELKSILDYVELSAGNQVGTLTQPLTQDQSLTDIVRVAAGKTVVIGGLQYNEQTEDGNEPAFLRNRLEKMGRTVGKRSRTVTRNALFIVLRPSVTIFEPQE